MSERKITVKQNPASPMPVEVLADSIKAISEGVRKLRAGRLNERALVLLIQHAAPSPTGSPLSQRAVKDVLAGIDALEREYLKPVKAQ
ncbi:unnamed protein product [Phaeothamnion confervicola]